MAEGSDTGGAGQRYTHASAAEQAGFTALPNVVLHRTDIGSHEKMAYALLKDAAWRHVEPELQELGELMGGGEKTVRRAIAELVKAGLIRSRRRGLGLPNAYEILPLDGQNGSIQNGPNGRSGTAGNAAPNAGARDDGGKNEDVGKDDPPVAPPIDGGPKTVGRKPVKPAELALAREVLGIFNEYASTNYTSDDWLARIILRHREHPDLDADGHRSVIAHVFLDPWWDGPPSPSVIYGNAGIFERSKVARFSGTAQTARKRAASPSAAAAAARDELERIEQRRRETTSEASYDDRGPGAA